MKRRRALTLITLGSVAPWIPPAHAAAELAGIRVWPGREVTRVTIEASEPITYSMFLMRDPARLVIDLDGVDFHDALREMLPNVPDKHPTVNAIRVGRTRPGATRVVLDLKREVKPESFLLAPVREYSHRLVVDLRPLVAEDVIAEFLAQLPEAFTPLPTPAPAPVAPTAPAGAPAAPKVAEVAKPKKGRTRVIAIDPGHGGEDPGAIGPTGLKEKDVTLAMAFKLKALIDAQPNLRAFLTRDDDYFVPLNERVEKARSVKAELLISIHADAFTAPEANGASVFALSDRGSSSATAKFLAEKENLADKVGGIKQVSLDAEVLNIRREISSLTKDSSAALGKFAVNAMARINRMHKKQVEFAGFAVLRSPDVPSILVETAFISNPEEEEKLASKSYQQRVAEALAKSAGEYLNTRNIG